MKVPLSRSLVAVGFITHRLGSFYSFDSCKRVRQLAVTVSVTRKCLIFTNFCQSMKSKENRRALHLLYSPACCVELLLLLRLFLFSRVADPHMRLRTRCKSPISPRRAPVRARAQRQLLLRPLRRLQVLYRVLFFFNLGNPLNPK